MNQLDPDTRLTRDAVAAALTAAGYFISPATLASMGHRGGGPEYDLFNGRAAYRWGSSLEWAKGRVRPGGRGGSQQRENAGESDQAAA